MPLWDIVLTRRTAVLEEFAAKARQVEPRRRLAADDVPEAITGLLDQLIITLRSGVVGKTATLLPQARILAADLGEAGANEGRDIEEVVGDFRVLHEAILDVIADDAPVVALEEQRVLARGIHRAIVSAVSQYAKARDRELQRAHAEHFAFLAHELRTPLSNITMGVDLLDEGVDAATLLPRVRRAAQRMRELLDNEISSARLAAGSPLHLEPVRLAALLGTVLDELRMQARDRNIELTLAVNDALELQADPRLLRSIFTNLVANAVKFTKKGGHIDVVADVEHEHVVCRVADGCGGLPEGKAQSMFESYRQTGEDRSGFGLGLSIVSEAVALHRGTIAVDNRPGEGCTMVVQLPRAGPPQS